MARTCIAYLPLLDGYYRTGGRVSRRPLARTKRAGSMQHPVTYSYPHRYNPQCTSAAPSGTRRPTGRLTCYVRDYTMPTAPHYESVKHHNLPHPIVMILVVPRKPLPNRSIQRALTENSTIPGRFDVGPHANVG